jgi:hypothetical protein
MPIRQMDITTLICTHLTGRKNILSRGNSGGEMPVEPADSRNTSRQAMSRSNWAAKRVLPQPTPPTSSIQ